MSRRAGERGQVTFFGLGLVLILLFVGGVSFDLWNVLATRRTLGEMADSAAAAGSNGLDVASLWEASEPRLDPSLVRQYALENLASQQDAHLVTAVAVVPAPDGVLVTLQGEAELTLLSVFSLAEPVSLEVSALARPASGGE